MATPKGMSAMALTTSSVERSIVSTPPMARSEVEAKNAVPFWSEDMMLASTMRFSRISICSIQMRRCSFMRTLRPRWRAGVISTATW